MRPTPAPDFAHLRHLTDRRGTFEHARFAEPRPEHGYCTDDMARVLVVTTREPGGDAAVEDLAQLSLHFLTAAQGAAGGVRNRMNRHGAWEDLPALEDAWGRALWGFGTAVARSENTDIRRDAAEQFARAAGARSPWPRAMAFAALGAAELLSAQPDHTEARGLLTDAADGLFGRGPDDAWPWPEERLTYANAVLPEAMIAAGSALHRDELLEQGLDLLAWLLEHETVDGHLSPTPVGGAGRDDGRPGFDQQPIEVAALADACARAAAIDGGARWSDGMRAAVAWFMGENDAAAPMWDPSTGGGFDGLHQRGVNLNQGTESTLALLSTLQHARRLVPAHR